MFNLIRNELHKLFAQRKMFVFCIILLAMCLLVTGMFYTIKHNPQLQAAEPDAAEMISTTGQIFPLTNLGNMMQLFAIFAIIMVAEMITEEYITGTLKLSLLQPVTRGRLLTAKVCSVWIANIILLFFSMIVSYLASTVLFGWGDQFVWMGTTYPMGIGILITIGAYLLTSLPIMAMTLVVLLASLYLNGSGAVIGLGLGFFFAQTLTSQVSPKLAPYLISTYTDFWNFPLSHQWDKLGSALIVLALYGGLAYILSLWTFRRKDLLH